MEFQSVQQAIAAVEPGRWAVAVSGGADSVALLLSLGGRKDLQLHVVHLDHQTRGEESRADAQFVRDLAEELGLPCTIRTLREVEDPSRRPPANVSARFRSARLRLFKTTVAETGSAGVLLAHHADDQAETVLQRLLRGWRPAGLAGMARRTTVNGVTLLRPLLGVRRDELRAYLLSAGRVWREDSSNASGDYQRNRLRRWLSHNPPLVEALVNLADKCRALNDWTRDTAPQWPESLDCSEIDGLPVILAEESARTWLRARGSPANELSPAVIDRLLAMCRDAGSARVRQFPGNVRVERRKGRLTASRRSADRQAQRPPSPQSAPG